MSDSVLKKQFQQKDVQRLRNIITGKYGDRTVQGVGYTKEEIEYKEGDIWEEDERIWTIKNGIKQNITKLDAVKKAYNTPLFCPSCKNLMDNRFDEKYYKIHKTCYNCVVEHETELKRLGLWGDYEKAIHNSDIDGFIKDFKVWVYEQIETGNEGFITEAGDVEKWDGKVNKKKALESLNKTLEYLEGLKK